MSYLGGNVGAYVSLRETSKPETDNVYDIGDATHRYANVYSVAVNADTINATTLYGDGSNLTNVTSTAVAANSVTLGIDTTGDYIKNITAGDGISITTGTGEGAITTVAHADTSSEVSVTNTNGTVIQEVALDANGHVTTLNSYDLDNRYYTKTESDTAYIITGVDTIDGGSY